MILLDEFSSAPDTVRVLLSREFDMSIQRELHEVLHTVLAGAAGIIEVDLDQVTFLDCAVIGEFVRTRLDADRAGRILVVTRPHGFIREVLTLANVLPLLTSRPTALVGGEI